MLVGDDEHELAKASLEEVGWDGEGKGPGNRVPSPNSG